jgi:hypothetical protein
MNMSETSTWPTHQTLSSSERQAHKLRVIERKALPSADTPIQALQPGHPSGQASRQVQWRDTVVLTRDGEFLMAVAIGPDGMVWSYRQDESQPDEPVADSMFPELGTPKPEHARPKVSLRCTHLCAQTIAVGFDSEGRPVVFGAQGLELEYAVCVDLANMRWSAPKSAHLDLPAQAVHIERVYTRRMGKHLHVSAMAAMPQPDGSMLYNAIYANWDLRGADFRNTPVFVDSLLHLRPEQLLQSAAQSVLKH